MFLFPNKRTRKNKRKTSGPHKYRCTHKEGFMLKFHPIFHYNLIPTPPHMIRLPLHPSIPPPHSPVTQSCHILRLHAKRGHICSAWLAPKHRLSTVFFLFPWKELLCTILKEPNVLSLLPSGPLKTSRTPEDSCLAGKSPVQSLTFWLHS